MWPSRIMEMSNKIMMSQRTKSCDMLSHLQQKAELHWCDKYYYILLKISQSHDNVTWLADIATYNTPTTYHTLHFSLWTSPLPLLPAPSCVFRLGSKPLLCLSDYTLFWKESPTSSTISPSLWHSMQRSPSCLSWPGSPIEPLSYAVLASPLVLSHTRIHRTSRPLLSWLKTRSTSYPEFTFKPAFFPESATGEPQKPPYCLIGPHLAQGIGLIGHNFCVTLIEELRRIPGEDSVIIGQFVEGVTACHMILFSETSLFYLTFLWF